RARGAGTPAGGGTTTPACPSQPSANATVPTPASRSTSPGSTCDEDGSQVSFAEDQDAVGEFGSDGQHEWCGEAVRPRTSRRDLHGVAPGAGQDGVERGGELPGAVADKE